LEKYGTKVINYILNSLIANETMNFPLLWPDILCSVSTVDMNGLLKGWMGAWSTEAKRIYHFRKAKRSPLW